MMAQQSRKGRTMRHTPNGFPPISNRGVATDHEETTNEQRDHNTYHMLYRRTAMGGATEVVYGPSVDEAIAALYERSVKWDDLRIVHQDLCWCQHTR